jgi:hypothetical protein
MDDFPLLKPALKSIYVKPNVELSEFWISGYFSIYCNFKVDLNPHGWKKSYYNRVVPSFNFSRSIKEYMFMEILASYFNVTLNIRSDNSRVDVNVYGLEKLRKVIYIFVSFPLQSSKQKEFILWSDIVNKLISISSIPYNQSISFDHYMPLFYKLTKELNEIRDLNNS